MGSGTRFVVARSLRLQWLALTLWLCGTVVSCRSDLLLASFGARTTVEGCSQRRNSTVHNGSAVCIHTDAACPRNTSLSIDDCFHVSIAGTVEWSTTIQSSAARLWTAAITRSIRGVNIEGGAWASWDSFPGQTADQTEWLLSTATATQLHGASTWWLGGRLTTSGDRSTTGTYSFRGAMLSMPAVMAIQNDSSALLFSLSLNDFLSTELSLNTVVDNQTNTASLSFTYNRYRLGAGAAPLHFTAELTSLDSADPRAALAFLLAQYQSHFTPEIKEARTMLSGTGWYSRCGPGVGGCDLQATNATFASELKEIGFKWVWNNNFAEFFMGSFIPPVQDPAQLYLSDNNVNISVNLLRARYQGFLARGVVALPYFSLFEFGGGPPAAYAMTCPTGAAPQTDTGEPWRDPNDYLANRSLQRAVLRTLSRECVNTPGWPNSFVMDPADKDYLQLLVDEANRHVSMLGDSFAGVSCDRGWPQLFNPWADDGISFCSSLVNGGRCRSLLHSFHTASRAISAIFHQAGKVMSYNPIQIPRVDVMQHFDSIFTEMSVTSQSNIWLVAALSIQKPATMWTTSPPTDSTFVNLLLHGISPMAPSPNGDHSLGLDGMNSFLRFGPMLRALQGRTWNLTPNGITTSGNTRLDSNMFDMNDGSLLGVLVPRSSSIGNVGTVSVTLTESLREGKHYVELLNVGRTATWIALQPGAKGVIELKVPDLVAMIRWR